MGKGKHTDSMFGECFDTLVQSCAAGTEAAEPFPPHPQPLSRVGAGGADSNRIRSKHDTCHFDYQCPRG